MKRIYTESVFDLTGWKMNRPKFHGASPKRLVALGQRSAGVPKTVMDESLSLLRGGAKISPQGRLIVTKKQLEKIARFVEKKPGKTKLAKGTSFEKHLLSKHRREFLQRIAFYGPLLKEKRLKPLIYLAERSGLGKELVSCLDSLRKARKEKEIRSLANTKNVARQFLPALRISGGEKFGKALNYAGWEKFGKALNYAGWEKFGKALNYAGGEAFGKALNYAGWEKFGKALREDFDRTIERVKKGRF